MIFANDSVHFCVIHKNFKDETNFNNVLLNSETDFVWIGLWREGLNIITWFW